jgi:hypothetical protein
VGDGHLRPHPQQSATASGLQVEQFLPLFGAISGETLLVLSRL